MSGQNFKIKYKMTAKRSFFAVIFIIFAPVGLLQPSAVSAAKAPAPKPDNRLIIKKIGVEAPIVESANSRSALLKGMWRVPGTSQPDKGGNTVITGHRWYHKPPHKVTFYDLDKLKKGDEIIVVWYGVRYYYKVSETKVVDPYAVSIMYPTKDPTLTLFTCTPLYSTKNRLVVMAKPFKPSIKKPPLLIK